MRIESSGRTGMEADQVEEQPMRYWNVAFCEPKRSLGLVGVLATMGVLAECPSFEFRRRVPRRNRIEIIRKPLIGGLIFVDEPSVAVAMRLGTVFGVDLSAMRLMCMTGKPVRISDDDMKPLRESALRWTNKKASLSVGDKAIITAGAFKGRPVTIVGHKGSRLVVAAEGMPINLEVFPFLLGRI